MPRMNGWARSANGPRVSCSEQQHGFSIQTHGCRFLRKTPICSKRSAAVAPSAENSPRVVARGMFSRDPDTIQDIRDNTEIIEVAPPSWQVRFPIVNTSLFETDAGLVLVDTGMSPARLALLDAIREVSDKPLHTIIYTHGMSITPTGHGTAGRQGRARTDRGPRIAGFAL